MFANNGKYSDDHTKTVEVDIAQLQHDAVKDELDHEYKYRFLYMNEQGEMVSLYNPSSSTVIGGAGDLVLTFSGYPGSGFEYCDVIT